MASGSYRLMAGFGLFVGCALLLGGVLMISGQIFWDALVPSIESFGMRSAIEPIVFAPVWIVWGVLLVGCICFLWGYGLIREYDWSPFVTSVFFMFLGIYLSVFVALAYSGHIPGISLPSIDYSGSAWTNQIIELLIVLTPAILAMLMGLFVLFRSSLILGIYEGKYLDHPPKISTCPICRSRVESSTALCLRCNPQQRLAALIWQDEEHPYRHELKFTPERLVLKLGRYDENVDNPDSNIVYFNVERNQRYKRISELQAEIRFDDVSGQFFIRDLGSRNKTYLNEAIVGEDAEYKVMAGDEIKLGDVPFLFETDPVPA